MNKLLLAFAVSVSMSSSASAGVWKSVCAGCHNYIPNATAVKLKNKYKTPEEFIKAAERTTNPKMGPIRNNVQIIQNAAEELYSQ